MVDSKDKKITLKCSWPFFKIKVVAVPENMLEVDSTTLWAQEILAITAVVLTVSTVILVGKDFALLAKSVAFASCHTHTLILFFAKFSYERKQKL